MKIFILAALWTVCVLHPVPEQANNPNNGQGNSQPQPSPTAKDQSPPARPSPPQEQNGANSEPNQPPLLERISKPIVDNWPVVLVAIWGIFVARNTLNHMRESAERQLRAYVVMEVGSIVNIADPINPPPGLEPTPARRIFQNGPVAHAQIKNTGQTPAFNVEHWGEMCFREYPLKSDLPSKPEGVWLSKAILGPGIINTKRFGIGPILTDAQVAELRACTAAIYVYGEIRYEDAFKKKHFTRYRFTHNEGSGPIGVSTELSFADKGNEAD